MNVLQMISKNDRYGAQRIFLDQVASLHARGHQITVVVRGNEGYVTDSVRAIGITCHGIPLKGISDLLFLRRLIKEHKIDLIHTVLDRADHTGLILSWLTHRPVISTMMVPRVHSGYRFMDRVITLVNKQAGLLAEKGVRRERICVIRPGINVDRFSRPDTKKRAVWQKKFGMDAFTMVFCHISSLLSRKAHMVSLELMRECKQRGEHPLLVIIGDPVQGEYYDSLIKRATELNVKDNIYFTGWTSEVPEILALCHFTVLPSENEALGVVLMEGMAAGTPIVARDGEGGAELINEYGTGFLYRPEDGLTGLAGQLVDLKRDTGRFQEMSAQCRKIAESEFSLSRFGQKLETLYREVLER